MAILIDEKKGLFSLTTKSSLYQMKADEYGVLLHTYYGKKTPVVDYSYLIDRDDRGFSGNPYRLGETRDYSLDVLPQEYACFGGGDFRPSALKVRHNGGGNSMDLRYAGYQLCEGKYAIPGLPAVYANKEEECETLIIKLKDEKEEISVSLYYGVFEEMDLITRAAVIKNTGEELFYLERAMSMELDISYGEHDWITFYGKHEMERQLSRTALHHGIQSVGSTRGASSHQYNPFVILADPDATEEHGECVGVSFLYSGDFLAEAEKDQFDQTRLVMGIHPGNFSWKLNPGESFYTPEAAIIYSDNGLGALSRKYHKTYRHNLCRGKYKTARRPVLINNWEGTYFDFTGEKLLKMAKEAADLGIELFVMDDGWFGKRDSDYSGLGDWSVNEKKLGCTLGQLSEQIHKLGMKFGIWFEPECVSEDSDLYREHPDWVLCLPGRSPMRGRYQLVLDFSREDVRENIFEQMCCVLDHAQIEYVKWDFNRSISDIYSRLLPADRQGEVAHRYVLGLYELLEKLTDRYPEILFEGCSGGGGRFDAGMLYYSPQIWCSDDTDAIERLEIQYGTSFGYPVSAVGSHVSACPNHQTKRVTPLKTRATVAMSGTFGYELDVENLLDEEKADIRVQIQEYKKFYDLIQDGDYYRLTTPDHNNPFMVWEFADAQGKEALVSVVAVRQNPNETACRVCLKGLNEEDLYRINGGEMIYPGAALMYGGLPLPRAQQPYDSWQFHVQVCL